MDDLIDYAIPISTFAVVTLTAELLGAANLGTAFGVGQVAFIAAVTFVLLRR